MPLAASCSLYQSDNSRALAQPAFSALAAASSTTFCRVSSSPSQAALFTTTMFFGSQACTSYQYFMCSQILLSSPVEPEEIIESATPVAERKSTPLNSSN